MSAVKHAKMTTDKLNEKIHKTYSCIFYLICYFETSWATETSMWLARSLWSRRTADKDSTQVLREVSTWFVELTAATWAAPTAGCGGTAPCWWVFWLERWLHVTITSHQTTPCQTSSKQLTSCTSHLSQNCCSSVHWLLGNSVWQCRHSQECK